MFIEKLSIRQMWDELVREHDKYDLQLGILQKELDCAGHAVVRKALIQEISSISIQKLLVDQQIECLLPYVF